MNYKIYKLKFKSPVHFGSDILGTSLEEADLICHSDTLFSALCLEYIKLNGYDDLKTKFIDLFRNGELLISSLFPYKKDELYVPKPFLVKNKNNDDNKSNTTEENNKKEEDNQYDRKAMKKISYIIISHIEKYLEGINNNDDSFLDFLKNKEQYEDNDFDEYNNFAKYSLLQKVSLRSIKNNKNNKNNNDINNNDLYDVGAYRFYEDCGLYFILVYNNDENLKLFENVLQSLQYSGIGGKRTSGYGLFSYKRLDNDIFNDRLNNNNYNYKMIISLYYPLKEELDDIELDKSYYSLIKRNGFVYSPAYNDNPLKRKSLCMFKEGSCFSSQKNNNIKDIYGNIIDVSNNGSHKVYRYGKVLYIGLN
ncbi:type III-A CRISPR-associated RAMP protein Csm4 [Brachyspira intermedia]|uniref:type III-A CRISPR-associated RAMP protein Csm4 n=1 Tax=Brachyspira intermedia TaxID=84377 RepID=UPI00300551C8